MPSKRAETFLVKTNKISHVKPKIQFMCIVCKKKTKPTFEPTISSVQFVYSGNRQGSSAANKKRWTNSLLLWRHDALAI
jgi:hypothetical protein